MKHIYYKNDFAVEITLLNASGEVVSPPDWQWHIEFTDGRRKYICSVDKGNAKVVGNTIMCYLDNHKFCCGEIGYKFVQAIPDLNYLDGFQNLITPKALPIELWEQESDNDINIQSSVVPAYVVYDAYLTAKANGYTGTAEEFYDALNHIVDINKKEAERVEAEANRVTAEQQRVKNFIAMERELTTATSKAETATSKAEEASKRADNSATAASQASVQAILAANGANAAAAQATQAMEKTNTATELANTATANANNSAVKAGNAATEANEATKSANDATEKAKTATIAAEQSAERANTAADNADVATSNATTATKRANDISADLEAKREADYWRGTKGEKGDDGVSPTVKTSKTGKVTTIEITDADGVHTATVNDGESVEVVQSTGTSEVAVMSQKASTMAFAANTPSGDPMHNMYVAMGAVWNGSGVDKTYPTPWADYAEDEEDKVCVHKSGCWMYGYIGDLKNNDMVIISSLPVIYHLFPEHFADGYKGLTYVSKISVGTTIDNSTPTGGKQEFFGSGCKSIILTSLNNVFERKIPYKFDYGDYIFAYSSILKYIYGIFSTNQRSRMVFAGCKDLRIALATKIKNNTSFVDSPKLSKHCVRYMIENATDATITITLHPEAYERAIADTGVQAALANKTNVSLAKGE